MSDKPKKETTGQRIARGLADALAYAQGDKSRATSHTVTVKKASKVDRLREMREANAAATAKKRKAKRD